MHGTDGGRLSPPLKGFRAAAHEPFGDAEVVIVGGGIVGVSAAYFLAEKGVSVALVEKGRIGGEQSGRNLGWCRSSGRDEAETPLALLSLELWDDLSRTLKDDTGFRRCGRLQLCETAADLAEADLKAEEARRRGIRMTRLAPSEIGAFLPDATRKWVGAYHVPDDGRAEPELAAPAIASAAQAAGARIYTNCAARGVDISGGHVTGVVTERGRIACSKVVVAAGAWSSLFLRLLGIRFPVMQIAASVMRTAPAQEGREICVGTGEYGYRRHLDGSYSVSPFGGAVSLGPDVFRFSRDFLPALRQRWRVLSLRLDRRAMQGWLLDGPWRRSDGLRFEREREIGGAPTMARLDYAFGKFLEAMPDCANLPVLHRWAGMIDASPDSVPTIDAVGAVGGLWAAAGFSGHGFGLGPGAARLLADLVTGSRPSVDPTPFAMGRPGLRNRGKAVPAHA